MTRIDLSPTQEVHERLQEIWQREPARFAAAHEANQAALAAGSAKFERMKVMNSALTALTLPASEIEKIRGMAERLHALIERTLDWVLASPQRLLTYFPDHERMIPYLRKTPGLADWQGLSRYDVVVTPAGELKVIELNTACPAGMYHAEEFSRATRAAFGELNVLEDAATARLGTIPRTAFMDQLLAIEADSGIGQDTIVLMNDESELLNELDYMQQDLTERGRTATIAHAADLRLAGSRLTYESQLVSLTYNKIRISTPATPNQGWRPGFQERYADFLRGIETGAMCSVNNLCALSVAEDKSLMWVMQQPEFQQTLNSAERAFLDEHLLWTWPLRENPAVRGGGGFPLEDYVARERPRLVTKPANEGRGFRVELGAGLDDATWRAACQYDPLCPSIIQEHAAPARLPVVIPSAEGLRPAEMYLTIGLFVIRGRYQGMLSRVSANPVTNVGKSGMVQAVFVIGD